MASINNNILKTHYNYTNYEEQIKRENNEVKTKLKIKKSTKKSAASKIAVIAQSPREEENFSSSSKISLSTVEAKESLNSVTSLFKKLRQRRHHSLTTNYRSEYGGNERLSKDLSSSICMDSKSMQNSLKQEDLMDILDKNFKKSSFFKNKKLKNFLNLNRSLINDNNSSLSASVSMIGDKIFYFFYFKSRVFAKQY